MDQFELYKKILEGEIDQVFQYLEEGGDPDCEEDGSTILTSIFMNRGRQPDAEAIKLLLKSGTNLNYIDGYKNNALFYALQAENYECAELLLDHGIDPQVENLRGKTPLILAIFDLPNVYDSLISKMLSQGADPNYVTKVGVNVFSMLKECSKEYEEKILRLIEQSS